MHHSLRITTPSRLHFGLLRFTNSKGPSYGGLGMMVANPRVVIELQPGNRWQANGPMAGQAIGYARKISQSWNLSPRMAFDIHILEAPPTHAGLGSGTQLALAIASGIRSIVEHHDRDLWALVDAVERGQRSAVGSHGFDQGGLLWETGYLPNQNLGRLKCRLSVPESWRMVLITPNHPPGLHGASETAAFEKLKPVSDAITSQLQHLAEEIILPAVRNENHEAFAEGLFQYGQLAGSAFESIQDGPYASPQIAACIEQIRMLGIPGVGQSSWGPTLFACCANQEKADQLAGQVSQLEEFMDANISISPPDNQGATLLKMACSET